MYVCGASGLKLVNVGEWRPERGGEPKGAVAVSIHRISIWMRSSDPNISIGRIAVGGSIQSRRPTRVGPGHPHVTVHH